jgi:hypothetical protein
VSIGLFGPDIRDLGLPAETAAIWDCAGRGGWGESWQGSSRTCVEAAASGSCAFAPGRECLEPLLI